MFRNISHNEYNDTETSAEEKVGFLVSETFINSYFRSKGRITSEVSQKSFWKYLDAHHDARLKRVISELLQGHIDEKELFLLETIYKGLVSFTEKYLINFEADNASLYRALFQFRLINSFVEDLENKIVLEIGPGSGWLSSLLTLHSEGVYSLENTQSHYVFQSALFHEIFKNNFYEGAFNSDLRYVEQSNAKLKHLPWWKICSLQGDLPQLDVITSNHMLFECSNWCLSFYVHMANQLLKSDGIWVIENFGAGYSGGPTLDFFRELLQKYGFKIHDFSKFIKNSDGIFLVSRNEKIVPRGSRYLIPLDINYFKSKYNVQRNGDFRLSSTSFLSMAQIPH